MDKIKLNANRIATLSPGLHWDAQEGLCIRISPTCASFYFYRHNPNTGKPIRRSLGKFPNMSVEAARKAARAMQMELDRGSKLSNSITLADLLDRYERHLKAEDVRYPGKPRIVFGLSWQSLAGKKLRDIIPALLKTMHDEIAEKRGRAAAAVAIKLLRTLYSHANELEIYDKNPAKKVRVKPITKREVFLNLEEVKLLRDVLTEQPQDVQDFFELCLLTGARKGNVCSMRWQDVNGNVWTIPAEHSKTKRAYEVPLHPYVMDVLQRRSTMRGLMPAGNVYVFATTSYAGHLTSTSGWLKSVRAACKQRGLTKHFTLHDLRRTFASLLTANGVPLTVVAKALGHASIMTTPIYARADTETVRKAVMLIA